MLFKVYFAVHDIFEKIRVPIFIKPAIGGLLVGVIGIFVPSVLGVGYGWAQLALNQNYQVLPPTVMLLAVFAEIFAMSFALGSGGSGGLFGPCVVTGTMIGASFGYYAHQAFPATVTNPSNYAIVGMMAFFGGAAKSPLAVIVMIAEMTGGYGLLAPSMIAVVVAYLLTGNLSIFYNQVESVEESPAHIEEYETLALKRIRVAEVMTRNVVSIKPTVSVQVALDLMEANLVGGLPVVSNGKLVGMVTRTDILKLETSKHAEKTVTDVMTVKLLAASPEEDLFSALTRMISRGVGRLPVVPNDNHEAMVGIITRTDIAKAIEKHRLTQSHMSNERGRTIG